MTCLQYPTHVLNFQLPPLTIGETLRSDNLVLIAFEVLIITFATWTARRFFDRRSLRELGLKLNRTAWIDLIAGFSISAFLFSMIYATTSIMGWSQFQSWTWESENLEMLTRLK